MKASGTAGSPRRRRCCGSCSSARCRCWGSASAASCLPLLRALSRAAHPDPRSGGTRSRSRRRDKATRCSVPWRRSSRPFSGTATSSRCRPAPSPSPVARSACRPAGSASAPGRSNSTPRSAAPTPSTGSTTTKPTPTPSASASTRLSSVRRPSRRSEPSTSSAATSAGAGSRSARLDRSEVGGGEAAVYEKAAGGDEGGVVAGEEEGGFGDLLGFAETAHRDVDEALGGAFGVLGEELLEEGGIDRAGAEGVDADAAAGELDAELAGEREDGALGGGVGALGDGCAHHGDEGGDVDHRAAARLEQVGNAVLAAEEDAAQV